MSDSGYSDGPWSTGFDWGTVEADPDLSAALQERTDQRDAARRQITALEKRLAGETPSVDRSRDFIQLNEDDTVDDVTQTDVEMFRLEMMDDRSCWICVYHRDGTRTTFWTTAARKPLRVTVTEERE